MTRGFPKPGDKMRFLNRNGYDAELARARTALEPGQIVTMKECRVGNWHHSVQFEEVQGHFNGVMFEPVAALSEEESQ